eukprot:527200_1
MLTKQHIENLFRISQTLLNQGSQCKHLKYEVSADYTNNSEVLNYLHDNGNICKQCILFLFNHCYHHMNNPDKLFISILAVSYYPNIARFVFHKTNLWLDVILRIPFYISCTNINRRLKIKLHYDMLLIMNTLSLFKNKHWKILTFQSTFMMQIIAFIEQEYTDRIHNINKKCKIEEIELSNVLLDLLLIFFTKWFSYFIAVKNRKRTASIAKIERKLKLFIYTLSKSHRIQVTSQIRRIAKQYLNVVLNLDGQQIDMIEDCTYALWKSRTNNQKCQRSKCKKIRSNSEKFYKCSACFVVMYCSKKCAKLDWKNGKHREICHDYVWILLNFKWDSDPQSSEWRRARIEIFKNAIADKYNIC